MITMGEIVSETECATVEDLFCGHKQCTLISYEYFSRYDITISDTYACSKCDCTCWKNNALQERLVL